MAADVAVAPQGVRSTQGVRIPGDSLDAFTDALCCRQGASVCLTAPSQLVRNVATYTSVPPVRTSAPASPLPRPR